MKAISRRKQKSFSKLAWIIIILTCFAGVALASAFGWIERSDKLFIESMKVRAYQEPIIKEVEVIREVRIAKVTAYSCGGLKTQAEIEMNCPSLKNHPKGRTATGTTPRVMVTVACDKANLGKNFELKGIGQVKCEDTGSAIKGAGRFDLYVETVEEAYAFGTQYVEYFEIN